MAVRLSQDRINKKATEKIRDFPSQSYDWFGFLIILIFVRKIRVSIFFGHILKYFSDSEEMHHTALTWQYTGFSKTEEGEFRVQFL